MALLCWLISLPAPSAHTHTLKWLPRGDLGLPDFRSMLGRLELGCLTNTQPRFYFSAARPNLRAWQELAHFPLASGRKGGDRAGLG